MQALLLCAFNFFYFSQYSLSGKYKEAKDYFQKQKKQIGDDFIDKHGWPNFQYINKNDNRFNSFLLDNFYIDLLKSILPEKRNIKWIITSLEGIFSNGDAINIYGGCSKKKN